MTILSSATVYDTLIDVLVSNANREAILSFRLSETDQARLDLLLDKNRAGSLTAAESSEIETYEQLEHVVSPSEFQRNPRVWVAPTPIISFASATESETPTARGTPSRSQLV